MAKHKYYIRKNPGVTGGNVEWLEVGGRDFYALCNSPEGKTRRFANMGEFTIEMAEAEFNDWRSEKNHADYLRDGENGVTILSLYGDQLSEHGNGEEVIPDETVDVESDVLSCIATGDLRAAIQTLDPESRYIIRSLYLSAHPKTERELANELGVTQQGIHKRKKKILEKLKSAVVKSKKIQQ